MATNRLTIPFGFEADIAAIRDAARESSEMFQKALEASANQVEMEKFITLFGDKEKSQESLKIEKNALAIYREQVSAQSKLESILTQINTERQKGLNIELELSGDILDPGNIQDLQKIKKINIDLTRTQSDLNQQIKRLSTASSIASKEIDLFAKEETIAATEANKLIRQISTFGGDVKEATRRVDELSKTLTRVEAIKQVGKEFKAFSDAEQRVLAAGKSVDKFKQKVTQLKSQGVSPLESIKKASGDLTTSFGTLEKAGSKILIAMGLLGTFRFIAQDIFNAAAGVFSLAEAAAKLRDAEEGFRRLASQTTNAVVALTKIRVAAGGTIDEFALIQGATKQALAGLPIEQIDRLVLGARALAAVTGRDAAEAFERLGDAVNKQERKLLDELGIVVRAEDLYKNFADSIGKTTDEMTANEKQTAFLNGTLDALNQKVSALGGIIEENQNQFLSFREGVRNAKLSIGTWISENESFQSSVKFGTELVNGFGNAFKDAETKIADHLAKIKELDDKLKTLPENSLFRKIVELQILKLREDALKKQKVEIAQGVEDVVLLRERLGLLSRILAANEANIDAGKTSISLTREESDIIFLGQKKAQALQETHPFGTKGKISENLFRLSDQVISLESSIAHAEQKFGNVAGMLDEGAESAAKIVKELTASELDKLVGSNIKEAAERSKFSLSELVGAEKLKQELKVNEIQVKRLFQTIDNERKKVTGKEKVLGLANALEKLSDDALAGKREDTVLRRLVNLQLKELNISEDTIFELAKLEAQKTKLLEQLRKEETSTLKGILSEQLAAVKDTDANGLRNKSDILKEELSILQSTRFKELDLSKEIAQKTVDIEKAVVQERIAAIKRFNDMQKELDKRSVDASLVFAKQKTEDTLRLSKFATEQEIRQAEASAISGLEILRRGQLARVTDKDQRVRINKEADAAIASIEKRAADRRRSLSDDILGIQRGLSEDILKIQETTNRKSLNSFIQNEIDKIDAQIALLAGSVTNKDKGETRALQAARNVLVQQGETQRGIIAFNTAQEFRQKIVDADNLSQIARIQEDLRLAKMRGEAVTELEGALETRRQQILTDVQNKETEKRNKERESALEKQLAREETLEEQSQENKFEVAREKLKNQTREALEGARKLGRDVLPILQNAAKLRAKIDKNEKEDKEKNEKKTTDDIRKENRRRIKEYERLAKEVTQAMVEASRAISVFGKKVDSEMQGVIEAGIEAGVSITEAIIEPSKESILGAITSSFKLISAISKIGDAEEKKRIEKLQKMQKHLIDLQKTAETVGQKIGDAITGGFSIDFDKLLAEFIKIDFAKNIAAQFGTEFAEELEQIQLGADAQVLGPEQFNRKNEAQLSRNIDSLRDMQKEGKLLNNILDGTVILPEGDKDVDEIVAKLRKGKKATPEELRLLGSRNLIEESKNINLNQASKEFEVGADQFVASGRAAWSKLSQVIPGLSSGLSKLEETIPTATFKAVTEGQADQLLLLAIQRNNFLAQISTSTNELVILQKGTPATSLSAGTSTVLGLENSDLTLGQSTQRVLDAQ